MIKFRGIIKGIDVSKNRWAYGYYCKVEGKHYIIFDDAEIKPSDPDVGGYDDGITGFLEVIPESVGQFTGIKDKNGKEIYGSVEIDGKMSKGGHILKDTHLHLCQFETKAKIKWQVVFLDGAFLAENIDEKSFLLHLDDICDECEIIGDQYEEK